MKQEQQQESVAPQVEPLRIEAALATKLNLAAFQNAVPVITGLAVVNDTDARISDLELGVTSEPTFFRPKTWRIDELGARSRYQVPIPDIALDGSLLSRLTEAETATVSFALRTLGAEASIVTQCDVTLELLPRNQWGGLSSLPDLVAAFVQPNEPAVERLLKQAAEVLRKSDKSSALDGYAGGARRAWELTSAIWSAVASMKLDYALPPASFEHSGQKVRGAWQIGESGLATCLDSTLLFCSALEQAGLNPLLVFTRGHAFAGVWLKNEQFSTTVVDDVTALRKRVRLKELVLFETTLITHHPVPSFSYAAERADQLIAENHDESFELAVDVRRARMQRIKPLASAEVTPHQVTGVAVDTSDTELGIEEAPDLPDESTAAVDVEPAELNPKDRLARWQRKLLDLSLRNNLLNFKEGKRALRLDVPDPAALEDLLATNETLKLLPRPDLMTGADPRDQALYEERERENVRRQHALDALRRREVFVGLPQQDLEARLIDLYRTARTSLQEGGANTLYVALGFLSWTREDRDDRRYRAPLILLPVTLQRHSARSGFTFVLHDDEPRFNPTLIEMLRQDFRLGLGIAEGELPRDDAGLDVDKIWKNVEHAIKDIKGWEVSREVVLSTFSFAKYLMWKDLAERTDQLRKNSVVRHLLDTPRDRFDSSISFPEATRLDSDFPPSQVFCPLAADSSQLSAIMAAAHGKNFVLIGPPGTGKSQTIANLIAQSVAEGKHVLFVSEKIAALDVVYRRLREVKLGEFCLELHSSKARKTDVLAQLNSAWEARGKVDTGAWQAQAEHLAELRRALNGYVQSLHRRYDNGWSIYDAIGQLSAGTELDGLSFSWPSFTAHDAATMAAMRDVADRLEVNAQSVGYESLTTHALATIGQAEWSPSWQQHTIDAARKTLPAVRAMQQGVVRFAQAIELPLPTPDRRAVQALEQLARCLPTAAGRDWRFVLRPDARIITQRLQEGIKLINRHLDLSSRLSVPWPGEVVDACDRGLQHIDKHRQLFDQLAEPWPTSTVAGLNKGLALIARLDQATKNLSVGYAADIEQIDVSTFQQEWTRAEQSIWPKSWYLKHRVTARLSAATIGNGKPDVVRDLATWADIRDLRAKIIELNPGTASTDVWKALDSKPQHIRCALRFQPALAAARQQATWEDRGFETIADGSCGQRLRAELARMRALRLLEREIDKLSDLQANTASLWLGLSTSVDKLRAALAFQRELRQLREEGNLDRTHDAIERGEAGDAMSADWKLLNERSRVEKSLGELDDLRSMTGGIWNGLHTHAEDVANALSFHAQITASIAGLAATPEGLGPIKTTLHHLLGDANSLLESGGPIVAEARALLNAAELLPRLLTELATTACFTEDGRAQLDSLSLDDVRSLCEGIIQSEPRLRAWAAWRRIRAEAIGLGLAPLVSGMESGAVGLGNVRRSFETNYCHWWLNAVVDNEPVIRNFVSAEHEKRIRDFRELDERFTTLTRDWLRARLCADLPDPESVDRASEWGTLRHEISKKSRHLPLRELMSRAPTVLTKLTPCLLMSPLSIAQYLPPDASTFDLVVFDEASQIPVWDAIGAIARGKQVVMVGDPKQLPPTSFFDRTGPDAESDDEDVEGDLESILDECIGANLPMRNLNWHYRSRHESLIAFSNQRYYESKLVTFPSPVTNDQAVSLHPVIGVYEKGASRTNPAEAKALVADIVARLRSPGFRESRLTIGVVTFNAEQQRLIEDLLDEARRQDPSLESYFEEAALEPLFVKNLESVQGDERDIMYFSITYGPDRAGLLSMNFGPLNRQGGERRLNVAITRARHELRVFASLHTEQMDLARTSAAGVRDLKHFLEFAASGPRALAEVTSGSRGGYDSPFERAVADALTKRGWHLHTQIGVSQFRIDLGVVDPDAPGRYLAGIECDGATYHRSATARDRDKLREQVLRDLGWEILRIWSTDWWIDPANVVERIDKCLQDLLDVARAHRIEEAARIKAEQEAREEASRLAAEAALAQALEAAEHDAAVTTASSATKPDPNLSGTTAPTSHIIKTAHAKSLPDEPDVPATQTDNTYSEADPSEAVDLVEPDRFFADSYTPSLTRMITYVINHEGPILDVVLARRIARAHGWLRTGGRIRDRVILIANQAHPSSSEDVGAFFWPSDQDSSVTLTFRRPIDEDNIRPADEICIQELGALAHEVRATGKLGEDALYAMARALGLQKLGVANRSRLEKAMQPD